MTGRQFSRLCAVTAAAALLVGGALGAQQQQPPAGSGKGPMAADKFKNIQALKDLRADQIQPTMQYFAASLGVQCNFCHVQNQFDSDDKEQKKTARKMIGMVQKFNADKNAPITLTCATCHHGRMTPERTPPLAVEMTPAEAEAAAAMRGRFGGPGGRGMEGGGRGPVAPERPQGAGAGVQPGARGGEGGGRGPQGAPGGRGPQRPTETLDQILEKYTQAMGGQAALAAAKTRVLHGTQTSRDLQTSPFTAQEKASGEYRLDVESRPNPTVGASDGKVTWMQGFGPTRELEPFQAAQALRLADFGLLLNPRQHFQGLTVRSYGNIDGTPTIVVSARVDEDVTEQLHFGRESGLLLRRTIQTRTPFGNLLEQVDYSDYRDVSGVKVPFGVRYATPNQVRTEKITDAKINVPIDDAIFKKPAAAGQ